MARFSPAGRARCEMAILRRIGEAGANRAFSRMRLISVAARRPNGSPAASNHGATFAADLLYRTGHPPAVEIGEPDCQPDHNSLEAQGLPSGFAVGKQARTILLPSAVMHARPGCVLLCDVTGAEGHDEAKTDPVLQPVVSTGLILKYTFGIAALFSPPGGLV